MKTKNVVLAFLSFSGLLFIVIGWNIASANSTNSQTNTSIRYVTPTGTGDCSSWETACSLHTALTNALSGDEILVMVPQRLSKIQREALESF